MVVFKAITRYLLAVLFAHENGSAVILSECMGFTMCGGRTI